MASGIGILLAGSIKEKVPAVMEMTINISNSKKTNVIVSFVVLVVFFLLSGIALIYFFNIKYAVMNYHARNNWEKISCKILSLGLGSESGYENNNSGPRSYIVMYWIRGEFTYSYKGKNYVGRCINFQSHDDMGKTNSKRLLDEQLNSYYGMSNPVCYVNPERPSEAVLDPFITPVSIFMTWVGVGFIVLSLVFAIYFYKIYQKYKDTLEN